MTAKSAFPGCRDLAACVVFSMAAVSAWSATAQCPRTLDEAPTVMDVPSQWVAVAPRGQRGLDQAGLYWGSDPASLGSLVPTSEQIGKSQERVRWKLVPPPHGEHYWIGCMYVGTTAVLFRRLDLPVTQCEVVYDLLPSRRRNRLVSVECR